ncbi:MAG: shikimate dehydrogenase [Flavobacterium sp. MedPE-SWcel]|uniref:shikimate dehydrogenase family protein n=1 Tax=uncultured Flavobacterium sp. TaxID=165435 RepID=UPI00091C5B52|nr:shikimate dehydrogenase [uncultured Flavobacterium sp.]OIQ17285.1 MAG: shikimate dehydrogenase [Flavobacterium sp. MedPE-SWcel]
MKKKKKIFGLVGRNISYSFSAGYFSKKFKKKGLKHYTYKNFDIDSIEELRDVITNNKGIKGLNVTIPYKEEVIPLLDSLSKNAKKIGAVNTIVIGKRKIKGYNTDHYGFRKALKPLLKINHKKALILGTGGSSKAVAFALKKLKIEYDFVSRVGTDTVYGYTDIDENIFQEYQIIINTTPLGTFPDVEQHPPIDYSLFTKNHIAFDLIYNPEETTFLKKAKMNGAQVKNGYEMLVYQAEKSWKIWNRK